MCPIPGINTPVALISLEYSSIYLTQNIENA